MRLQPVKNTSKSVTLRKETKYKLPDLLDGESLQTANNIREVPLRVQAATKNIRYRYETIPLLIDTSRSPRPGRNNAVSAF